MAVKLGGKVKIKGEDGIVLTVSRKGPDAGKALVQFQDGRTEWIPAEDLPYP